MRHWTDNISDDELRLLLLNMRIVCSIPVRADPVWSGVVQLFGVGSTTARRICARAGIDPDMPLKRVTNKVKPAQEIR